MNSHELAEAIAHEFPWAAMTLSDHIRNEGGELIPHLFFFELSQKLAEKFERGESVAGVMGWMESVWKELDESATNVVELTLIGDLPSASDVLYELGPQLAATESAEFARKNHVLMTHHDHH